MMGISESLLKEGYCVDLIPREVAELYLKWISYVPRFWKIEETVEKGIEELTEDEKKYLERYHNDHTEGVRIFSVFLNEKNKKTPENVLAVTKYIRENPIGALMGSKMSNSEKNFCFVIRQKVDDGLCDLEQCIQMLEKTPAAKRALVEDYLLELLLPEYNKLVEDREKPEIVQKTYIDPKTIRIFGTK